MPKKTRWEQLRDEWSTLSIYQRFESMVALVLTAVIGLIIVVSLFRLSSQVLTGFVFGVLDPLDQNAFQVIFGEVLTVLIALEFNHTLQFVVARQQSIIQTKIVILISLLALARKIAPPGFLIGASVGDEKEASASAGADYVGIGPWRVTATKSDAGRALGAEGVRRLLALVKVPAVVIGGVRPIDVAEIAVLGAAGVAVAGGILSAPYPETAARSYSA